MGRTTLPFSFVNQHGQNLAGLIDLPQNPAAFGVFAPCFTCTKESHGAFKICRALADENIAMLRFDISGLGKSEGNFFDSNFTTRIHDIIAACHALSAAYQPPKLLIGHSISGTAALSAAKHLPFIEALATLGSPRDTQHVLDKFRRNGHLTEHENDIELTVIDRKIRVAKNFAEDMLKHDVAADTALYSKKLFVFQAPHDDIVAAENAQIIYDRATGDKELVMLDELATHLFENRKEDALFVAETLAEWCKLHLA